MLPSEQVARPSDPNPGRALAALLYGGFVLTGVITTILGPAIPVFADRWSLSDAMVGMLFPAQFAGAQIGNLILSLSLIHRAGFRSALILGYGLMSIGVAMLAIGLTWPLAISAVFCYGCGIGLTIPTTNLWIAEINPGRRASALNVLNLAWSSGALMCPVVAALFTRMSGLFSFLVAIATLAATASLGLGFTRPLQPPRTESSTGTVAHRTVRRSMLLSGAILFFLYVGVENSVAGWVSSLVHRTSSDTNWMIAPAFFWGMLLIGRAAAPAALRRVKDTHLAIMGLLVAVVGTSLLVIPSGTALVYLGTALTGLGLSSVYPIAIAELSRGVSSRVASAMFLLSGFGGATMPWAVGLVSTRVGSLRASLTLPILAIALMLGCECYISRHAQPPRDCLRQQ